SLAVAVAEKWTAHWKHLYDEVVTSGLCTGCAGCVVACPYDVLSYDDHEGVYKPFHIEEELGPGNCGHGEKGCTYCTRACRRCRAWPVPARRSWPAPAAATRTRPTPWPTRRPSPAGPPSWRSSA